MRNKHKFDVANSILLPARGDSLDNPLGHPSEFELPIMEDTLRGYINTLYSPRDITVDWEAYKHYLSKVKPNFHPHVLFVGHDASEIENITLMSLGGVVQHMNGSANYALVGKNNVHVLADIIANKQPEWIGFNLYTGLTDYVFAWIKQYKIERASYILKKTILDFDTADKALKNMVREAKGPLYDGNQVLYAPVIIGGHFNNYSFSESFCKGGDYIVRGKGVNILRDILLGLFTPGIYHDPMPYANIPRMDREIFYNDMYEFSDTTKRYVLSRIKSVLSALGCNYTCTYCYISSLIDNLKEAYKGKGVKPPSIIQDRPIDTVLAEGKDILRLDEYYGVKTSAVFDQADISLNNMEWWHELGKKWMNEVGIPFYIQARPAMLAGKKGIERIESISNKGLVSGISMAIESGDQNVRKLLLDRHENNTIVLDAIKNVKSFGVPLRTQAIVGLPVIKPSSSIASAGNTKASLVDRDGKEYYYEDPLQESLKCLELVCSSYFRKEDYYWNAIYSPFPGTPLGDYTIAAGFATSETASKAYLFNTDSGLNCFSSLVSRRQIAFSLTSNFFAHFKNGKDLMNLFIYGGKKFDLDYFSRFVSDKSGDMQPSDQTSTYGLIPSISQEILEDFIDYAYPREVDLEFKKINKRLLNYYLYLLDGLVLAAKMAVAYFKSKKNETFFSLSDLYRVERLHYYDHCYHMNYIPEQYADYLTGLIKR
jgi:radical SAM superfamily enzyme YgiQ (UPF0313 family)|tara:strand:- start:1709 stop:3844 length:2136 start_codon:yes stop_codon:yes gene_type:complete